MAINPSIITRDLDKVAEPTGNIYESIHVIGQRAKQISSTQKEELTSKLSEFASTVDNLEEVFENKEQIEISKFYERMPKPSTLAMEEFMDSKVYFRHTEADNNE
ncbi:DNA-directed RNA polymerase subunit omega [Belliella kenyensis]|uniref:DNA-directed RNA polymerase subunit omega n=1 Tax=Belliella kenyensis TaxID=1472724 RepID=A0ABV8EK98_9BACT|nr:DNA-directed RNA polymerase subunit omega [Belliella kenyensis]MCH7402713.1 DNA-directed RNA polymerase subunit omega [Belliella kenyensis]MDN3603739.1 DNA-directed RNA polymerase subunit omega [Belliella kenyensis]